MRHLRLGHSLFCAIGLHDLAGNFLLAAEDRCRCSVLAINDRKLPAFYRCHDDRSELRLFEIFGDLVDIGCAPSTYFSLIRYIDHELVSLYPFQGCRPGRELGCRRIEPLRAEGYEHRVLHL
jgi:hypothetical protein